MVKRRIGAFVNLLGLFGLLAGLIAVGPRTVAAAPTELFFSEYVEGSSNNKALEIYNGTGAAINLAAGAYSVQMFFNGNTTAGTTINLQGTVAAGDVFVLADNDAGAAILAQADPTSTASFFNGDDAIVLRKGTAVIDSIGQIGVDPGSEWGSGLTSTANNTLFRKDSVEAGDSIANDAFDPSIQWDGYAEDTFGGLGRRSGITPPPPPQLTTIGEVQGVVADDTNGATHRSPRLDQTVAVQGVIYQKTLARTSSGGPNYGFFIQNTAATDDDDPNTSDGIFVFMSGFTTLRGGYMPEVGDEVVISGRVTEFFNLTQLAGASLVAEVRSGVDLNAEVPAFETNPPNDLAAAGRYWERREGMRAQIPAGSVATSGRDVFSGTADAEIWVIRGDHPVAQRTDPYARRVFRDPHPLDNNPIPLFDDGNGYRILMGSLGVKAASGDTATLLPPARTFDTLTNAPIGGVYFAFGKYQVQVEQQPAFVPGVDPSLNAPPQAPDREVEYSVANYNVENLYDFRDDPADGCDFTGNAGCPGVRPPFDYVPGSNEEYQAKLQEIARQIAADLYAPDLLLIQEAEDQDICSAAAVALACGAADNADGKPDTLQELALTIKALGGPAYDAAYDRDGADDRGIVSAFMYRTDRVQLLAANADDPVLGSTPDVQYRGTALAYNADVQNPKALNADLPADVDTSTGTDGDDVFTRAPQVGLFRVWRDDIGASVFIDLYAVSNHFSSGPDRRVGQRIEQAAYNAAIYDAIAAADGQARVVIGGDLNVFPRPDDPFAPGQPIGRNGQVGPSDQLAPLYNQGLVNLFDRLVAEVPSSAYGYVFQGQAQTLDHQFVSPALLRELVQVRSAHINADWPADYQEPNSARGASDHDPLVSRWTIAPTLDLIEELVRTYDAAGQMTGKNTTRILLDRIERARRFQAEGKQNAYQAQLQAFANQVQGFAPKQIAQPAADALAREMLLLLERSR